MIGLDWRRYWTEHDENEGAAKFAQFMADRLDELFDWKRVSSFADFGCGPATMVLVLAERHPETSFHGFDVSEPVLAKNRVRARDANSVTWISAKRLYPTSMWLEASISLLACPHCTT